MTLSQFELSRAINIRILCWTLADVFKTNQEDARATGGFRQGVDRKKEIRCTDAANENDTPNGVKSVATNEYAERTMIRCKIVTVTLIETLFHSLPQATAENETPHHVMPPQTHVVRIPKSLLQIHIGLENDDKASLGIPSFLV